MPLMNSSPFGSLSGTAAAGYAVAGDVTGQGTTPEDEK